MSIKTATFVFLVSKVFPSNNNKKCRQFPKFSPTKFIPVRFSFHFHSSSAAKHISSSSPASSQPTQHLASVSLDRRRIAQRLLTLLQDLLALLLPRSRDDRELVVFFFIRFSSSAKCFLRISSFTAICSAVRGSQYRQGVVFVLRNKSSNSLAGASMSRFRRRASGSSLLGDSEYLLSLRFLSFSSLSLVRFLSLSRDLSSSSGTLPMSHSLTDSLCEFLSIIRGSVLRCVGISAVSALI
uniref:Uncharacterized protein n=1 Tax=Cacopsylla melanoneura TaxID=428564 RepID=A0A8D8UF65_9HEMI